MAGEKNFETRLKKWLESEGKIETIAGGGTYRQRLICRGISAFLFFF